MSTITNWFKTQLNNPQVVFLTLFLLAFFAVLVFMGQMLAPLLAAIVIAYLLEGLVKLIQRLGISRLLAVVVVYLAFLLFVTLIVFGLMPLLSQQTTKFVQQIPSMLGADKRRF